MNLYCRDCRVIEVTPMARDGRCIRCRSSRRHSEPRERSPDRIDLALLAAQEDQR